MKKFKLYDEEFIVDENLEKYNEFRSMFIDAARVSLKEFDKIYEEQITNLDILINKIPQLVRGIIINAVSTCAIRALVREGIININDEVFLEKYYYNYLCFDEYFEPILEKYVEITEASESLKSYREMQKANRSRWQGGGFGVKGAIKGAVTAGALNLGTDMLRSFGDSSNASRDARKINLLKESVYKDSKTISLLRNGIYNCVFCIFYGLIDELVENKVMSKVSIDSKQAQIIFDNTFKYEEKPENIFNNVIKCLRMDPYNFEFYSVIIEGDKENKEIFDIARFFGFDKEIDKTIIERNQKRNSINVYFTKDEIKNSKYNLEKESDYLSKNNGGKPSIEDIKRNGNFLAISYSDGEDEYPEDLERAFYWYKRAAAAGNKIAETNLARCYLKGEGIEQDYTIAVEMMEKICADKEDKDLEYELGKCYFKGLGVNKDYKKAHYWFEKSTLSDSYYYLGVMYEEAKEVERDLDKAKTYFLKASGSIYGEEKELAIERLEKYENKGLSRSEQRELDNNKGKEPKETLFGKIMGVVIWLIFAYIANRYIPWNILRYVVVGFCIICAIIDLIDEVKKKDEE